LGDAEPSVDDGAVLAGRVGNGVAGRGSGKGALERRWIPDVWTAGRFVASIGRLGPFDRVRAPGLRRGAAAENVGASTVLSVVMTGPTMGDTVTKTGRITGVNFMTTGLVSGVSGLSAGLGTGPSAVATEFVRGAVVLRSGAWTAATGVTTACVTFASNPAGPSDGAPGRSDAPAG
jgi:hypothetical protein